MGSSKKSWGCNTICVLDMGHFKLIHSYKWYCFDKSVLLFNNNNDNELKNLNSLMISPTLFSLLAI